MSSTCTGICAFFPFAFVGVLSPLPGVGVFPGVGVATPAGRSASDTPAERSASDRRSMKGEERLGLAAECEEGGGVEEEGGGGAVGVEGVSTKGWGLGGMSEFGTSEQERKEGREGKEYTPELGHRYRCAQVHWVRAGEARGVGTGAQV
jgi:hypothetical protein